MTQPKNINEAMNKIEDIKDFIFLEERSITKKNTQILIKKAKIKIQKQEVLAEQKSVLRNALKLYYKRNDSLMHL